MQLLMFPPLVCEVGLLAYITPEGKWHVQSRAKFSTGHVFAQDADYSMCTDPELGDLLESVLWTALTTGKREAQA